MSENKGWTDDVEVNFDEVPDELVNVADAVYHFKISKVEVKKTQKGVQALNVVLKPESVHASSLNTVSEVPKGAKSLYETISFDPAQLFNAKNLLKSADIELPKRINIEVLTDLAEKLLEKGAIIAKTNTSPAANGFAAKSRVGRYYSEESLAAALNAGGTEAPAVASEAAPATRTRRRGGTEQAAA